MKCKTDGQEVLKVGDRVEAIGDVGVLSLKGCCGVVKKVNTRTLPRVLVEFDKAITLGHNSGGACKDGHGWWGRHEDFKVIKKGRKKT